MISRKMNRVPKGVDTKLSTPCVGTVNWSKFFETPAIRFKGKKDRK